MSSVMMLRLAAFAGGEGAVERERGVLVLFAAHRVKDARAVRRDLARLGPRAAADRADYPPRCSSGQTRFDTSLSG